MMDNLNVYSRFCEIYNLDKPAGPIREDFEIRSEQMPIPQIVSSNWATSQAVIRALVYRAFAGESSDSKECIVHGAAPNIIVDQSPPWPPPSTPLMYLFI